MTNAELIQLLETMPKDLEVGTSDDMGDIEKVYAVSLYKPIMGSNQKPFIELQIETGWKEPPSDE